MKFTIAVFLIVSLAASAFAQEHSGVQTVTLRSLLKELIAHNAELQAWRRQSDAMEARVGIAGTLDDPELTYMREQMPGFRWTDAEMQQVELMQMVRFPTKLAGEKTIASMGAEQSLHEYTGKALEVIARFRSAYAELWFAQQALRLNRENASLVTQVTTIVRTRFGNGEAMLQDVLKANVELAKLDNQQTSLRQQEISAMTMLLGLLNRSSGDSLGVAILPDSLDNVVAVDTLRSRALRSQPMVLRDSLSVEQSRIMLTLAKSEYLPDFKFGLRYVTAPMGDFRGWSISAGITLPFAPWTLGKSAARVSEAEASVRQSESAFMATRTMVLASITDVFSRVASTRQQIETYRKNILPQARTALKASLTAYQGGTTDFLMLIDAYRTLVELSMESLMLRMQYEQASAELDRQVGMEMSGLPAYERSSQ
jgi:outer membrane protein TolC